MKKNPSKDYINVYLCGTMLGGKFQKPTIDWRYKIRKYYSNWKNKGYYEINFLDPWNGELKAINDEEGIFNKMVNNKTIFMGDVLAIQKSDIIIANLNQYNSSRISVGTFMECGMALAWGKPIIIITDEENYQRYSNHPFTAQACAIFKSVDEFLDSKILNWFYKRLNTAIYDWKL